MKLHGRDIKEFHRVFRNCLDKHIYISYSKSRLFRVCERAEYFFERVKMDKKLYTLALVVVLAICAPAVQAFPMPALSKKSVEGKFVAAEQGFAERWQSFSKDKNFSVFSNKLTDEQILAEFDKVIVTRNAVYYENPGQQPLFSTQDFERSQELLVGEFYKNPHTIAFTYNYSHPSYNSSNVTLNGHRFLALEGPQKPEHVKHFKRLLINYDVKKIVRLTKDVEAGVFKSENYWEGNSKQQENGQQLLTYILPEEQEGQPYSFTYYAIDNWEDNTGIDPKVLLDFVQQVRKDYKFGELIAVHCSAGVGRTGTFIAAFLILEEIDKQLKSGVRPDKLNLSIEELVYKITLQRAYLVGEKSQYLTLYKVVQEYLARI